MAQSSTQDQPSLSLTRQYAVAPETVWRAWTDPQALNRKLCFTWAWKSTPERVSLVPIELRTMPQVPAHLRSHRSQACGGHAWQLLMRLYLHSYT